MEEPHGIQQEVIMILGIEEDLEPRKVKHARQRFTRHWKVTFKSETGNVAVENALFETRC